MLRRLTTLTVIAALLGGFQPASAQDAVWPQGPDRFTPYGGEGMWPPNGAYPPASSPYGSYQVLEAYRPAPGMVEMNGGYASLGDTPQGYGPGPTHPYNTTTQYLPNGDLRGPFYHDTPFQKYAKAVASHTWLRMDYLNWSLTGPGEALIGAEVRGVDPRDDDVMIASDERDGFPRFDPATGDVIFAQAHDLSGIDMHHRNGLRATLGMPFLAGEFEAGIWSLEQAEERFSAGPHINSFGNIAIPAITLLIDGQKADASLGTSPPMILFDDAFHTTLQTELMGTEFNYVHGPWQDGIPFTIQPIVGFRYVRMHETLTVTGSDLRKALNPQISSESLNNHFGPTIGMRAQWQHKRLLLGLESKLTFAVNRHEDRVRTSELFRYLDTSTDPATNVVFPARQTAEGHTDFAPIYSLQLYGQWQLTQRMKVRVGYDFMTLFETSRPYNNIYWNDTGLPEDPTSVVVRARDRETFYAQGLFVSGEISLF